MYHQHHTGNRKHSMTPESGRMLPWRLGPIGPVWRERASNGNRTDKSSKTHGGGGSKGGVSRRDPREKMDGPVLMSRRNWRPIGGATLRDYRDSCLVKRCDICGGRGDDNSK